jgi:protein phosphatase
VIADGMGGHNAGEVASRLAVDTIVEVIRDWSSISLHPFGVDAALSDAGNVLRTAVLLANAQILERATTAEHYAGMGTTVVVTRVTGGRLVVAHVGDSRLYLFDGRRLRQVTRDDSWVATVLATDPKADPLLLQHHPMRNALTNVVGARTRTDVHVVEEALAGGELLLLTTDGVHGVLDDGRLEALMREEQHPRELAERVVAAALTRGSRDNCTAIVARYQNI